VKRLTGCFPAGNVNLTIFGFKTRLAVSGSSNPVKLHASAILIPATGSKYELLADSLFYSVSQGA